MVATNQLLDSLKQIGLNLYERKLWVALLSRGTSTAGELSSLAKVPHSRTYDVLESLAEKGFVVAQNTKPLKYVAINPTEALDRAKKKIREDADASVERITSMQNSSVVKELEKIYKNGVQLVEPGEMTGALKGKHNVHQQLGTLFKNAKKNISIITTSEGLKELHENHGDVLKKVSSKGVKIRIAAPVSREHSDILPSIKSYAEVRKSDLANGRMAVIDNNHVVMAVTDDRDVHESQDLALWTQSEHLAADVMSPVFNQMWKTLPSA